MGYKQGLIKAAIKIVAFFVAIIVALTLYKPVSKLIINSTNIDENIHNSIVTKILPEGATPDQEVSITNSLTQTIMEGVTNTVNGIADTITVKIIEAATLLLLFVLVKILLKFITVIADWTFKLPILKQFNAIGGTIYGFLRGVIIIYLVLAIILLISSLIDNSIIEAINKSFIGGMLYNNNILVNILF